MANPAIVDLLKPTYGYGLAAFGVALVATPICRFIAYKTGIVDRPDDLLKPHGRPVAYLGGIGICIGLLVGLVSYTATLEDLGGHWGRLTSALARFDYGQLRQNPLWNLAGIVLSCAVITLVGLLDDILNLRPRTKVLGQILAASILLLGGVGVQMGQAFFPFYHMDPWILFPVSIALCLIAVVASCNAVNLLDGLDGLCGGVTGIIALGFLALSTWLATWNPALSPQMHLIQMVICLAMVGGIAGFLPYNVPPASIFMGDAGSMLLGFFVAVQMAMFCEQQSGRWFLAALVVFSLPILDTSLAVVRRLLSGKSIFAGDRSHLYDQLVDRGWPVKKVVFLFYALAIVGAVLGVLMAIHVRTRYAVPIYAVGMAGIWILFWKLGMIRPGAHAPTLPGDPKKPG
ncbi:MAG: MraY family glycosyltransferase [Planctomycetota bacterium]